MMRERMNKVSTVPSWPGILHWVGCSSFKYKKLNSLIKDVAQKSCINTRRHAGKWLSVVYNWMRDRSYFKY
jgi:hypothetical protein